MKVLAVTTIDRGPCVEVVLDADAPNVESQLRRESDDALWTIKGIQGPSLPNRPKAGETVTFLLEPDADPQVDDEIVPVVPVT